jgi:hypothetical protein
MGVFKSKPVLEIREPERNVLMFEILDLVLRSRIHARRLGLDDSMGKFPKYDRYIQKYGYIIPSIVPNGKRHDRVFD